MAEEPKKGLFKKIGDALSTRDEKAAAEKAKADALAAQASAAKAQAEAASVRQAAADADKKRLEAEAKVKAMEAEKQRQDMLKQQAERAKAYQAMAAAAKPVYKIIKEHTIVPGDTLSALALHFYGHATPPYWNFIMEVNKEIGTKVEDFKPGKVIKIAELPPELKK
jgi:nucleoid-associated protein YgaU